MKQLFVRYWHPTPVFWRKLGDSLLAITTFTAIPAMLIDMKWVAISIFVCGVLGKFLTNFFKEDDGNNDGSKETGQ